MYNNKTMKIVCPYCENVNDVSKGSLKVTCSKCGQSFDIEQGKQKTVNKYKELQSAAYNFLYRSQKFESAYNCYEDCLSIKENDLSSIIGMCLAITSMSRLDDPLFYKVIPIIENYNVYLDIENTVLFLHFIKDMLDQIEFYYNETKARVVVEDSFMNENLFKSFVKASNDISGIFKYFEESFEIMNQDELSSFKEDYPYFEERFNDIKNQTTANLNTTYNVLNVGDYDVKDGIISMTGNNKKIMEIVLPEHLELVVENVKGKLYMKICTPIMISFGVLALIFFIIFGILAKPLYIYLALAFLLLGIATFGLYRLLVNHSAKHLRKK